MSAVFYDIQHTLDLTAHQRRVLALGITKLHNTAFLTSRFSVHVKFTSSLIYPHIQAAADYFVGGEELRECNRILVYIQREGFGFQKRNLKREEEIIAQLAKSIEIMWDSYVCNDKSTQARLHAIMVIPGAVCCQSNSELWERSDSDRSCLTFGFEDSTSDIWDIQRGSDKYSTSHSEYSSCPWENQTTVCSNRPVEPSPEDLPRARSRLSRKAKFHKLNSMT